jgi:hypothetical protein
MFNPTSACVINASLEETTGRRDEARNRCKASERKEIKIFFV